MNPIILLCVMSPTALAIAGLVVYSYHRSGMKQVNDYEKELKQIRSQVIKRHMGSKTYHYIKDNLEAEHVFLEEEKRLDEMFKQNMMDKITYDRMQKVLQLTFNEKLVKIYTKLSPITN